jgi:hybrid polyketide synthase/nonribosomal peptide synthetase ACE1
LFQCFIDYRQGHREKIIWGDLQVEFEAFNSSRPGYDISLDIFDDPDGECIHVLEVQKELYGAAGAQQLANSYQRLVKAFAKEPDLSLEKPDIFDSTDVDKAIALSQGQYTPPLTLLQ